MGVFDRFFSPESPDGKREAWVKVCPRCRGMEVTSRGAISRRALSPNYVCQTCGYQGAMFPEFRLEDAVGLPHQTREFIPSRMPLFSDFRRDATAKMATMLLLFILLWLLSRSF